MRQFQLSIDVDPKCCGLPVDKAIIAQSEGISRKKVRRALDQGAIFLNGKKVTTASRKVRARDHIYLKCSVQSLVRQSDHSFVLRKSDILYESDAIVAINKPPLLCSQPGRSTQTPHVESVISRYYINAGLERNVLLCHRLDKDTSGVILCAHDKESLAHVMAEFKRRKIRKKYEALVWGVPQSNSWSVANYLSTIHAKSGNVCSVRCGGKFAETSFKVIFSCTRFNVSLVECMPSTGRSHQIRVHLSEHGLPIIGDKRYNGISSSRLHPKLDTLSRDHHFLHAAQLQFTTPDGIDISVQADRPILFEKFVRTLNDLSTK